MGAGILLSDAFVSRAQNPGDESVATALEKAANFLAAGRPRDALDALQPVARRESDNPWMWFYRGTACVQLGNPYKAMKHYDRALDVLAALGNPDPELVAKVRLHRLRARQQVFRISFQPGLAFDTNVTYLGKGTTNTIDQISGEEDAKFGSQFHIDYAPIADEADTLAVGVRLGHAWNFSVEQFNYQDYGAYVRYARRIGRNWEAAVRYDYDITCLGNESFLSNHALTPSIAYHWDPASTPLRPDQSMAYYTFEARDFLYDDDPEFDRDGLANAVGFEQSFQFDPLPRWTWDLTAGYRFTSISTEGTEYDRPAHDFYLGLSVPLVNPADTRKYLIIPDKELIFGFNVQWHLADYRNPSLIDSDHRERSDRITTYGWSLSQKLIEDPDYGDLTLHTIIHWTDADSNVTIRDEGSRFLYSSPFTYDKVVYGIQLAWTW